MISFLDYDIEKCYLMYAALPGFVSVLHHKILLKTFTASLVQKPKILTGE